VLLRLEGIDCLLSFIMLMPGFLITGTRENNQAIVHNIMPCFVVVFKCVHCRTVGW